MEPTVDNEMSLQSERHDESSNLKEFKIYSENSSESKG